MVPPETLSILDEGELQALVEFGIFQQGSTPRRQGQHASFVDVASRELEEAPNVAGAPNASSFRPTDPLVDESLQPALVVALCQLRESLGHPLDHLQAKTGSHLRLEHRDLIGTKAKHSGTQRTATSAPPPIASCQRRNEIPQCA